MRYICFLAIIHLQERKIARLTNDNLQKQMKRPVYPIARPVLSNGSEYRIPCTRKVLGLQYYRDVRGTINRHVWNEMQVRPRRVTGTVKVRLII